MHISHKSQCLRSSIYNFILNRIPGKITAFSKHNSEFPPEEQLTLLLSTIPKSPSFSDQTIQSSHCRLPAKPQWVPHIQLICEFLPLRSSQNCNSVLASMVSSKGKLLSVHFYHRAQKIFSCNSFNAESAAPVSTNQLMAVHYPSFFKVAKFAWLSPQGTGEGSTWEPSGKFRKI